MTRRTTRTTHPGAVIRAGRGVAGYTGDVTPDAVNDPPVVFPDRLVAVPANATSPLRTDGEEIPGSGSIAVTDGTTTVAASSIQMPSGTVSDLGAGTAGVGLILARYKFSLTHASFSGIGGNFPVSLMALPTGSTVMDIIVVVTTAFDTGTHLAAAIAPHADLTNSTDISSEQYSIDSQDSSDPTYSLEARGVATGFTPRLQRPVATGSCDLIVYENAVQSTSGALDVYAIIATPAS